MSLSCISVEIETLCFSAISERVSPFLIIICSAEIGTGIREDMVSAVKIERSIRL